MSKPPITRKRRSRIAHLGKPFLVTVSLGTPLAGCTGAEMDSNPPRLPECLETVPVAGTPCQEGPVICDYGDCAGVPNVHASCDVDGRWQVLVASCNPPPPAILPNADADADADPDVDAGL